MNGWRRAKLCGSRGLYPFPFSDLTLVVSAMPSEQTKTYKRLDEGKVVEGAEDEPADDQRDRVGNLEPRRNHRNDRCRDEQPHQELDCMIRRHWIHDGRLPISIINRQSSIVNIRRPLRGPDFDSCPLPRDRVDRGRRIHQPARDG